MTMIQKVDGKSVRGLFESGCCDVVYVLPGSHQIFVHHSIPGRHGTGTLTGNLAAGRVYEAEGATWLDRELIAKYGKKIDIATVEQAADGT